MFSQGTIARTRRAMQALALLGACCLILVVLPGSVAATSPTVSIENVMVSNVRDVAFTVSWTTGTLTNGLVRWGTSAGNLSNTSNDTVTSTSTHYVTISGLSPSTSYYFEVESGGTVGNNNGVPFMVTTGADLVPSTPGSTIYGYAYLDTSPQTPVANAIVFLRIEDNDGAGSPGVSQWLSARTAASGVWFYSLSGIRTENLGAYFTYTAGSDNLYYWGEGGINGRAGVRPLEDVVPVPVPNPAQLPNLTFVPLGVSLASFEATPGQAGVTLTWTTVSEIGNQGFNLYRAGDPASPQDLLAYVPSQAPGSTQGFAYQWLDEDVVSGETYYYWLEAIDLAGATTLHGPVSATYQGPTAVSVVTFDAQPAGGAPAAPWMLALPALLGAAAYGLRRRSRRPLNM